MTLFPTARSVRTLVLCASGAASFGSAAALAYPIPALPKLVPLAAEKIYVPNGFDDNDNVEAIVHGNLPSTCYKLESVHADRDPASKTIKVQAFAYRYGGPCLQMLIPFTSPARVGLVPAGDYTVTEERTGGAAKESLRVKRSLSIQPDDYLYAPIQNATLVPRQEQAGEYTLRLEGKFPYMFTGCMRMERVITDVQKEVVVVQPVAKIVDDEECSEGGDGRTEGNAFTFETVVKGDIPREVLLHVRSLNGESYNRHYENVSEGH